ncbi:MAG: hypothetical protein JF589_09525 [Gemmatimonadetes bacterium]|nr:hypothetical protein [Gemmatimonadota bacterium]
MTAHYTLTSHGTVLGHTGAAQAQMDRLMDEAARVHHFRLVLERYESLKLELHDATGRRVAVSPMIVKQLVPTETVRAFAESVDPEEARWIDEGEPCYLVMAHLDGSAAGASAVAAATAA